MKGEACSAVLGVARRPLEEYLFYALCLLVALSPLGQGGESTQSIFLRHTALTLLAMGWAIRFFWFRRGARVILLGYDPLIFLFLAACVVSYSTSSYKFSSENRLVDNLFMVVYLYLAAQLLTRERSRQFLIVVLFSAAVQGAICLIQRMEPSGARVSGTFYNPNMAATFILCALTISVSCFFWMGRRRFLLVVNSLLFGVLLVALLFVGSRSSVLALLLLISFFILSGKRWKVLLLLALCVAAFAVIPNISRDRLVLQKGVDLYDYERWHIWKAVGTMIVDHPWLGVGLGNFKHSVYPYNFPVAEAFARYGRIFGDAHNAYLELCAEVGVPAFLIFLAVVAAALRQYQRARNEPNDTDKESSVIVQTAFVLLCVLFVQASFHDIRSSPPNVLLGLTALCIIRVHGRNTTWFARRIESARLLSGFSPALLGWHAQAAVLVFMIGLVVLVWPLSVLKAFVGDRSYKEAAEWLMAHDLARGSVMLERAIAVNPGQPFYHRRLAHLYLHRFRETGDDRDLKKAVHLYERAVSLNDRYPEFYRDLGECYEIAYVRTRNSDYLTRAASNYEKAVNMHPTNPFYRVRLGIFHLQLGQEAMAFREFRVAVELEPNFLTPRYLLAKIYERQGNGRAAEVTMEQIRGIEARAKGYLPRSEYEAQLIMDPELYLLREGARVGSFAQDRAKLPCSLFEKQADPLCTPSPKDETVYRG